MDNTIEQIQGATADLKADMDRYDAMRADPVIDQRDALYAALKAFLEQPSEANKCMARLVLLRVKQDMERS